ncbi:MAG: hypothetical protein ACRD3E_11575 [Terriglobales bacterium]
MTLDIWLGIDEAVRRELLETVWNGAPRKPELLSLYNIAEQMIAASAENVVLQNACAEVCGASPAMAKD